MDKLIVKGPVVVQNIEMLLLQRKMSKAEFYKRSNITSATFSNWRTGTYAPSHKGLTAAADALGVSLEWLVTDHSKEKSAPADAGESAKREADWMLSNAIPVGPGPAIPILGEVRCGQPMYAEDNIIGYEPFIGNSVEQHFALKAVGDSLNAAGISEGETVNVRRQDIVDPGQIAVVCVNGDEATLKRFRQEGQTVVLSPQSYNPAHQPQIYDLKRTPVHVMGRVVEIRKKV